MYRLYLQPTKNGHRLFRAYSIQHRSDQSELGRGEQDYHKNVDDRIIFAVIESYV